MNDKERKKMTTSEVFLTALSASSSVILTFICLLITYNTYKKAENSLVKTVIKRSAIAVSYLCAIILYWTAYLLFFPDNSYAVYPLYFGFLTLFMYIIMIFIGFEEFVKKYETSEEERLEKMGGSERLDKDYYVKYD